MKKSSSSSRGSKRVIRKKTSRKPASKAISLQSSKTLTKPAAYPRSAGDAFVTQKMLYSVRDELMAHTEGKFQATEIRFYEVKTEIHGVKFELDGVKSELNEVKSDIRGIKTELNEVKSDIRGVKIELNEVKSDIRGIKSELNEVKSEIYEVRSEIHGVKADLSTLNKSVHRVALLVEEQNNRNKIVLDGLTQLFERQDRVEKKLDSAGGTT